MCTTLLAPQITVTKRLADVALRQGDIFRAAKYAKDRKQPLTMKWVVVIDEHGNRGLRMRWTVTRSPVPTMLCKLTLKCVQPAVNRVCDSTPGPQAAVAIY